MPAKINYKTNQKIGNLTFLKEVNQYISPNGEKYRKALFRCYCGNEFETTIARVKSGHTKSCGCYKNLANIKRLTKHGLYCHPLYNIWCAMKRRCYGTKTSRYYRYGGRGIKICDGWKNNFLAFYNWSINNGWKKGLTIDRIDNDGNYEPENCQWLTKSENSRKRWYDNKG